MEPTSKFLIARLPNGEHRWAAIDASANHLHPKIGERRFVAFMSPFPSEAAARHALFAEGASVIEAESRKKRDP